MLGFLVRMKKSQLQHEAVTKILTSSEFSRCNIAKKLLEYLYQATQSGEVLKETTIAMDVFGKDASFNPSDDPIVRVHIHNLRRKLQTYYLTEGQNDRVRLEIPKGRYHVQFVEAKPLNSKSPLTAKVFLILNVILFVTLLTSVILSRLPHSNRSGGIHGERLVSRSSPFWGDLFSNQRPIQVVLGNQFFFLEGPPSYPYKISRISSINSAPELSRYLAEKRDTSKYIIPYKPELFEKEILLSLQYLLPSLFLNRAQFELKASSELTWQDLEGNNILYIGTNKTLGILGSLLSEMHIRSDVRPHRVIVHYGTSSDCVQVHKPLGTSFTGPRMDYVLIYKLPGPNLSGCIMIFSCTDNAGVLQSVKTLTDPVLSKAIFEKVVKKHGHIPRYFEMLLEVSSMSRTGFKTTYLESFEICPDIDLVKPPEE